MTENLDPRQPLSFKHPEMALRILEAMPDPPPEKTAVEPVPSRSFDQVAPYILAAGNDNMLLRSRQWGGCYSVDNGQTGDKLVWLGGGNKGNHLIPELGDAGEYGGANLDVIDYLVASLDGFGPSSKNILVQQGDPKNGPITYHYYFNNRYEMGNTETEYQDRNNPENLTAQDRARLIPFVGGSALMEQVRREPSMLEDPKILRQVMAERAREKACFDIRFPSGTDIAIKIHKDPFFLDRLIINSDVGYNKLVLDKEDNQRTRMMLGAQSLLWIALPGPVEMRNLVPEEPNGTTWEVIWGMNDAYKSFGADLHNALLKRDPSGSGYVWAYDKLVQVGLYRKAYRQVAPAEPPAYTQRDSRRQRGSRRGRNDPAAAQQYSQPPRIEPVVEPTEDKVGALLLRYPRAA